jgi:hypothetical protein
MKTTLELPDELYRRVKTKAATENKKIRDLVSEGLELLMKSPVSQGLSPDLSGDQEEVLVAMGKIRQCPPSLPVSIHEMIEEANRQRRSGWNREDR